MLGLPGHPPPHFKHHPSLGLAATLVTITAPQTGTKRNSRHHLYLAQDFTGNQGGAQLGSSRPGVSRAVTVG